MRARIADALNGWLGTTVFTYLVPNYIIMVSLGAFLGTLWAVRRAKARGLDPDPLYGFILWVFPIALLGGRFIQWIRSPETYPDLASFFDPIRGDSAAYGGFIAGAAVGIAYLHVRGKGVWVYLDCIAPSLGLATALTRLGCFLDGCCYGAVTASPIAVRFPPASVAFAAQVEAGLIPPGAAETLPVYPTQLFLLLKGLVLAALTAWHGRSRKRAPGETFCLFWVLYACFRFVLEFPRADVSRGTIGSLSTSQAISAAVLVLSAFGLWLRRSSPPLRP